MTSDWSVQLRGGGEWIVAATEALTVIVRAADVESVAVVAQYTGALSRVFVRVHGKDYDFGTMEHTMCLAMAAEIGACLSE